MVVHWYYTGIIQYLLITLGLPTRLLACGSLSGIPDTIPHNYILQPLIKPPSSCPSLLTHTHTHTHTQLNPGVSRTRKEFLDS